jgi:hypothetical protein
MVMEVEHHPFGHSQQLSPPLMGHGGAGGSDQTKDGGRF